LLGRCLPTTYFTIYHGFKRMEEEQGLLNQQKKIIDAAGIEPMTSRLKTSTEATKPQGLIDNEGIILPFG
jgi:hypothetical protein